MTNVRALANPFGHPLLTKQRQIVYLACPYTDTNSVVRQTRFEAATSAAATLIRAGKIVYSPITMTHPIDKVLAGSSATLGSDYWVAFDEAFMEMCSEIVVLTLDGWEQSSGVTREIKHFEASGKRISYFSPNDEAIFSSLASGDVQK